MPVAKARSQIPEHLDIQRSTQIKEMIWLAESFQPSGTPQPLSVACRL
jgi:hypothetical protein